MSNAPHIPSRTAHLKSPTFPTMEQAFKALNFESKLISSAMPQMDKLTVRAPSFDLPDPLRQSNVQAQAASGLLAEKLAAAVGGLVPMALTDITRVFSNASRSDLGARLQEQISQATRPAALRASSNAQGAVPLWDTNVLRSSAAALSLPQLSQVEQALRHWDLSTESIFLASSFDEPFGYDEYQWPAITAPFGSKEWFRLWMRHVHRAITDGATFRDLIDLVKRSRAARKAERVARTTRLPERVVSSIDRVRHVVSPHAPPVLARFTILAEGMSIT